MCGGTPEQQDEGSCCVLLFASANNLELIRKKNNISLYSSGVRCRTNAYAYVYCLWHALLTRRQGLSISRPILIGSTSTPLTPEEKLSAPPDHTHKWTVAVRSAASAPLAPISTDGSASRESESGGMIGTRLHESELDLHRAIGGKDDLSYFIKRVQFRLHDTYAQPTRSTSVHCV